MSDSSNKMSEEMNKTFQAWVLVLLREVTGLTDRDLKETTTFEEINLESLAITAFIGRLEAYFPDISKTFIFDCRNIIDVCHYLKTIHPDESINVIRSEQGQTEKLLATEHIIEKQNHKHTEQDAETDTPRPRFDISDIINYEDEFTELTLPHEFYVERASSPVAIVGMHGRFPDADNVNSFWDNLINGKDSISEIPSERWPLEGFFQEGTETRKTGKSYAKWGGFIKDVDKFDPQFFGISAKEAKQMDPQERIFLESAWHAMQDASLQGERAESLNSENGLDVGVFIGLTTNTYSLLTADNWQNGNIDVPAAVPWSSANRVSYALNLCGPSIAIDTACSSSLVAIHQACESIRRGECRAAIAGGVNLYLHPAKYIQLCQLQMLSPTGRCHTYGADADGFVPGEGVATIVLRPLSDALENGDRIHGVIKGTAVNHSGRTNGYTVPSSRSQASLIQKAMEQFELDPQSITCLEAHGTGTKLGDPIEFAGIKETLPGDVEQRCAIGSVKSNIGHLESAAGIAGVIKVLLQLRHKKIAPSLWSGTLNPALAIEDTRFFVPQSIQEWVPDKESGLRRAGISSFGAGGTNGHVIIEEFEDRKENAKDHPVNQKQRLAFVFSAKTAEQLNHILQQYITYISSSIDSQETLLALAYTLQCGRQHHAYRFACMASTADELVDNLQRSLTEKEEILGSEYRCAHIAADEEYVEQIQTDSMQVLSEEWIKGNRIHWSTIWPTKPDLISDLPLYPFQRERHWIKNDPSLMTLPGKKLTSDNHKTISYAFTGSEYFLQEHQIDGSPIFPAAAFVEHFIQISQEYLSTKNISIKNVTLANPFRPKTGRENILSAKLINERDSYSIEFFNAEDNKVYCRGRTYKDSSYLRETMSLKHLRTLCRNEVDIRTSYPMFAQMDMHYGEHFRGMQRAWVSENRKCALVEVKSNHSATTDMIIEPGHLDSILQCSIVFSLLDKNGFDTQFIPYSFKSIEYRGELPKHVFVHVSTHSTNSNQWQHFDLHVFDEDGASVLDVKDFRLRTAPRRTTAEKRNSMVDDANMALEHNLHTYVPSWKPEPLINSKSEPKQEVLVVFDRTNDLYRKSQKENDLSASYLVLPGKQFTINKNNVISMDVDNVDHVDLLWRTFEARSSYPDVFCFNIPITNEELFDRNNKPWESIVGIDSIKPVVEVLRKACDTDKVGFHIQVNLCLHADQSHYSLSSSIAGFLRALHEEFPRISANIVKSIGDISAEKSLEHFYWIIVSQKEKASEKFAG